MITDKELNEVGNLCERKIKSILNREGGTDLDYIRNLQTLITLKEGARREKEDEILGN